MEESLNESNPMRALDALHRSLQTASGIKPDEYKVVSLHVVYPKDPWGSSKLGFIESRYDLPKGQNPCLIKEKEPEKQETVGMPWL